jgi:hypothetical protein
MPMLTVVSLVDVSEQLSPPELAEMNVFKKLTA